MRTFSIVTLGIALMLCSATLASAQATRTWVSGVGDDANPCSRTAPCKTFAGAISKTAAGGEINTIDAGAYGAVTITKSITIFSESNTAGVLAVLGSNGIIVNAPGVHVVLRGLDIHGAGSGTDGVRFLQGASLTIENCRIYGFTQQAIEAPNAAASQLFVKDSTLSGNVGGGILITGLVDAVVDNTRMERNGAPGVRAEAGTVTVRNSTVTGNITNGIVSLGTATITVENTLVSGNTMGGLRVAGGASTIQVGNSTIVNNAHGLLRGGGSVIVSLGNNTVSGNAVADGVFDATIPRL